MVNCMSWSFVESNLYLAAFDIYADHLPILNQITWPYNEYQLKPSNIKSVIKCVLTVSGSTLGKKASWVSLKQTQKTLKYRARGYHGVFIVTPRISQSRHIISMEFTPDHHHN